MLAASNPPVGRAIGRYLLYMEIASGGMATVHLGRLVGPAGFARTVAVKCLHPAYTRDPSFVSMLLDEARLASRISHPNVVSVLDVVEVDGTVYLVMDYVHGESLGRLMRASPGQPLPVPIVVGVVVGMLLGLHAAHEATTESSTPLGIVHRDVSPQNVLVGADGVARVLDFGIAKAASRLQTTNEGQLKGKLRYMSPEQVRAEPVDRRSDIFAAAVVLWEALTGRRLFDGPEPAAVVRQIVDVQPEAPSRFAVHLPPSLDGIVLRGLAKRRDDRFSTARDMAAELQAAISPANALEIGEWVERISGDSLRRRASAVTAIERSRPAADETTAPLATPPALSIGETRDAPAAGGASEPARARRLGAVVAFGACCALGAWWLSGRSRTHAPGAESTATADQPLPSVAAVTAPAREPATSNERAGAAPEADPTGSRGAAAGPAGTARAPTARPRAAPTVASSAPARQRPECTPAYTLVNGIKRFKPECL
jgi:serine/threonine-protein kinase